MADEADEVRVLFDFAKHGDVYAVDLSSFLYDFHRLYATMYRYATDQWDPFMYGGGPYQFRRSNYRMPKPIALRVRGIQFTSPGWAEIATTLTDIAPTAAIYAGGAAAVAAAVHHSLQSTIISRTWPLTQRKQKLEIHKLELEIEKLESEAASRKRESRPMDVLPPVEELLDTPHVKSALRQLEANPLKPTDVTIEIKPEERWFPPDQQPGRRIRRRE